MINFGVGNYGVDQALLRLKREFSKHPTKIVIMGVVPETICRIVSVWKHYYEYGNTFGFKPRFYLKNNNLNLIENPIDEKNKFEKYQNYLDEIKRYDFFYENSGGDLNIQGDVYGPFTLQGDRCDYGESGNMDVFDDAIDEADPSVNFGPYDAFVVIHAGQGYESGGDGCDIWSNQRGGNWQTN